MIEKKSNIERKEEKCILVSVIKNNNEELRMNEHLDELEFLALTAGAISQKRFTQKMSKTDRRTYVGEGKLEEIRLYVEQNDIELVIFDDELRPSQGRNIEAVLKVKILDRTNLILDIFASRATTAYAKTQVELAQYQYLLPRLTGMWTHLERQRGGIGMRGPGETEIETDRRIIYDKISKLKDDLKKIDRQMAVQRGNRSGMIRVALVGYTNVGKSTLMNLISKSELLAENKLFATLDTTVRKIVIDNIPFLMSDTVGFIRKLPHQLVESFKSTLDEVREADLLLHIVDVSHPDFDQQYEVVNSTLQEIGAGDKPVFVVFNKIDDFTYIKKDEDDLTPSTKENMSLVDIEKFWIEKLDSPSVFISAKNKTNIDEFKKDMYDMISELHRKRFPYNNFLY